MAAMKKQCFKCLKEKDLTEFYRHPMMADGLLGKCKECTCLDARKNRASRLDEARAYDRQRGNRQTVLDTRKYRKENAEKYAAHVALNNALRDGKVEKTSDCEVCQSTSAIEAHHHDYSCHYSVWWLCAACHKHLHALMRRSLTAA